MRCIMSKITLGLVFYFLCTIKHIESFTAASLLSKGSHWRDNALKMMSDKIFKLECPLEDGYKPVELSLKQLLPSSVVFIVQYPVPFDLNLEPDKRMKLPVVTKDGDKGEQVGDILRACTAWSQGMSASGVTQDIMSFAGNVKWQKSVFETSGASFSQVVEALKSNTIERSSIVTLVFERATYTPDEDEN